MKSPFPWFGGKSRVADLVWERFGDVQNYVEPFFGSGAVLLERPTEAGIETVNDLDCMVANFWRALKNNPDAVADAADWPVNEVDQHARHLWLSSQEEFRERMKTEPDYYDAKIAGWWVWGQCSWIGSGWCSRQLPHLGDAGRGVNRQLPHLGDAGTGIHRKLPHLGDAGTGIHRKLPHLGDAGRGVNRQLPHLGNAGMGVNRQQEFVEDGEGISQTRDALFRYMNDLAGRLRRVRVCCGDWSRVCGPSPTVKLGTTGVFLDPPYLDGRTDAIYSTDSLTVAHEVREWAIAQGDDRKMRIALCGYEGEHQMPESWECVEWKARGGYGSQGDNQARENSAKERIWFSPHCLGRKQMGLF
jgi:site-specific DNA-adenine methylase